MTKIKCIDGLSGSGEANMARELGKILGSNVLHSGPICRFVAHQAILMHGTTLPPTSEISAVVGKALPLVKDFAHFFITNKTGLGFLHNNTEISIMASCIDSLEEVREVLAPVQRTVLRGSGPVAEGKDMGTTIFSEATSRFFLAAPLVERNKRKWFWWKLETDSSYFLLLRRLNLCHNNERFKIDTPSGSRLFYAPQILGLFRRGRHA